MSNYDDGEEFVAPPKALGARPIGDVLRAALREVQVRHEYGVVGYKTGVSSLDKYLSTALQPGTVGVFTADTGIAKTAWIIQTSLAMSFQGCGVEVSSLEDDPEDNVKRMIAQLMESGDIGAIRDGFVRQDGSKMPIPKEFDEAVDTLAKLNINWTALSGTIEELILTAEKRRQQLKSQGINQLVWAIDQLSEVTASDRVLFSKQFPNAKAGPPPRRDDTVNMLEWQMKMLTEYAKRTGTIIFLNHQLNTKHEENEFPTVRSLRGSQGIAHKAHFAIALHRPGKVPNPAPAAGEARWIDNTGGQMWIGTIKQRKVQPFKVEVQWDGGRQLITDLGVDRWRPYSAPEMPSLRNLEGIAALAALRQETQNEIDAAVRNVDQPALEAGPTTLPKLSGPGTPVWKHNPMPEVEPVGVFPPTLAPLTPVVEDIPWGAEEDEHLIIEGEASPFELGEPEPKSIGGFGGGGAGAVRFG